MREFFRGWRRKVGVVMLVMACVFMGLWVRSLKMNDFVSTDCRNATYRVGSYGGVLSFQWESPPAEVGRFMCLDSFDLGENNKAAWEIWNSLKLWNVQWKFDFGEFHFKAGKVREPIRTEIMETKKCQLYTFPYWFFETPLTGLSAFLLIKKPRQSATPKISQPINDEGGVAAS